MCNLFDNSFHLKWLAHDHIVTRHIIFNWIYISTIIHLYQLTIYYSYCAFWKSCFYWINISSIIRSHNRLCPMLIWSINPFAAGYTPLCCWRLNPAEDIVMRSVSSRFSWNSKAKASKLKGNLEEICLRSGSSG